MCKSGRWLAASGATAEKIHNSLTIASTRRTELQQKIKQSTALMLTYTTQDSKPLENTPSCEVEREVDNAPVEVGTWSENREELMGDGSVTRMHSYGSN